MKKTLFILSCAILISSGAFAKKQAKTSDWDDLETISIEAENTSDDFSLSAAIDEPTEKKEKPEYDMASPLNDSLNELASDTESEDDEFWEADEDDESEPEYLTDPRSKRLVNRIDMPHRTFEMGMKYNIGVCNSYLNTTDTLVSNLVIDLNKIAAEMPAQGLNFNTLFSMDLFTNLNLKNGVHVGFNSGMELNGNFGLGKEIFDFLAKGNQIGESIKMTGDAYADVFIHTDVAIGLNIFNDYHLEIIPSLFKPVAHVITNEASGSIRNTEDGKVFLDAKAELGIYTFLNTKEVAENFDPTMILDNIKNGWGFDITSTLDKKILESLTVQAYSRIPLVPGRLNYKNTLLATADGHFDGVNALLGDESDNSEDFGAKFESQFKDNFNFDTKTTSGSADYSLHRPFRMGARAAWEPFGSWFTIGGLLGFGFKEPFTTDARGYMEYDISTRIGLPIPVIGQIISLKLSSGYLSESFTHQAIFGLNFRAVELNVGVSAQGSDFGSSFKGSGVGAFIYLAAGW